MFTKTLWRYSYNRENVNNVFSALLKVYLYNENWVKIMK